MPEPIAWTLLSILWLYITYLIGNDKIHICNDDNSWKYRLPRGIAIQLVFGIMVGISMLMLVAFLTVLGVY